MTGRRRTLPLGALLVVVLAVSLALFAVQGPQIGGDTPRYTHAGEALFHGGGLTDREKLYVGYIAYVGLVQAAGLGNTGIVAGQILLTVLATAAAFSLARRLAGTGAGVIAAVLFGVNPEVVRWNLYVLPEAPYVAWLMIAVWAVDHAARDRRWVAPAVAALLLLASTRANGWLPAAIAGGYLILERLPSWRVRIAAIGAVVAVVAGLGAVLPARSDASQTLLPGLLLRQGAVIWHYEPSYLSVAPDPTVRDPNWPGFVAYTTRHPGDSTRVFAARIWTEVRQTRPYYAAAHNLVIAAWILVLYAGAAIGFVVGRREHVVWLIVLIVLAHFAVIAVTSADYDGRYGRHYFPLLAVVCGYGLATARARLSARRRGPRTTAAAA